MSNQIFRWTVPNIALVLLNSLTGWVAEALWPASSLYAELQIPPFLAGGLIGVCSAFLILCADEAQRRRVYRWMLASGAILLALILWRDGVRPLEAVNAVQTVVVCGALGLADPALWRRWWPLIAGGVLAGAPIGLLRTAPTVSSGPLFRAVYGGLVVGMMVAGVLAIFHLRRLALPDWPFTTPAPQRGSEQEEPERDTA
ncbi:MAG TPA: hypothetical protein VFS21_25640 [Roseiflexaceae bacterium]|nr:hypothetical protein [Roseiflexaceae bacterium]